MSARKAPRAACRASLRATALALVAATAIPSALRAQDSRIEELLSPYLGANAAGYTKPLAEILGAGLSSGFVRSARIRGRYVRFDLEVPNAFIGDDQKVFQATTEGAFTPQMTADAPTIVGSGSPTEVTNDAGLAYVFPAGLAVERLAVPVPQITVGSVAGTEATVRWVGFDAGDLGEFRLLGFGVRHSLSQYMTSVPLDLAIGVIHHTLAFADAVDLTATFLSLQGSEHRGPLVLYGGVGYETSAMDVSYAHRGEGGGQVRIDVDGAKGIRVTGGIALELPVVKLHADYTLGTQKLLTLGIGLGN